MSDSFAPSKSASDRPEVALLLACTRTQITPDIETRIRTLVRGGVNWIELIQLAMPHDVMPLLYRNLRQVCGDSLPESIFTPLSARFEAQAAQARSLAAELVRVLAVFEQNNIRAVPYKGPALAQRLYGDVALREFGDLDIMVLERDVPRALDLIRGAGYEFAEPSDAENLPEYIRTDRELQLFRPNAARVELQWRFSARLNCVKGDPERFLQRSETISLAGAQIPSLPLEVYLLILSLHATKHKWEQLKLICDIAEILRHPDLDWDYVLGEARDLGLRRMLAVGALLAENPLDVALPDKLRRGLKFDSTARTLTDQVRQSLFNEPDADWHTVANFPFQYKIRERLRDRATMLYRNIPSKMAPDDRDREFIALPGSLSPMYYLIRPVRWAWEKISDK
jgi:hypothetical protein